MPCHGKKPIAPPASWARVPVSVADRQASCTSRSQPPLVPKTHFLGDRVLRQSRARGRKRSTAEGHVVGGVAVAAQRHVASGEHQLKLAVARFAKDRNRLLIAKPTGVIFKLLIITCMPIRGERLTQTLP